MRSPRLPGLQKGSGPILAASPGKRRRPRMLGRGSPSMSPHRAACLRPTWAKRVSLSLRRGNETATWNKTCRFSRPLRAGDLLPWSWGPL